MALAGAGTAKDDATTKAVGGAVLLAVLGSRVVLGGGKGSSNDGEEGRGLHCEYVDVLVCFVVYLVQDVVDGEQKKVKLGNKGDYISCQCTAEDPNSHITFSALIDGCISRIPGQCA